MPYQLPSKLDYAALLQPFEHAQSALLRFDERLRAHPLAEGLKQRIYFAETVATTKEEGDLIYLEDLVLRDAGVSSRVGDIPLSRALLTLQARRLAGTRTPQWVLSDEGLAAIAGVAAATSEPSRDERSQHFAPEEAAFDRLKAWVRALRLCDELPALLAAAVAFDWRTTSPPMTRNPTLGALLVAVHLRRRHHPALTIGIRTAAYRPLARPNETQRVIGFLDAVATSADLGMKELMRLSNAREILQLKLKGRRKSSKLPALVDLLLSRPIVTIPMAARALRISQQAVAAMIPQLGSTPRELTDRQSYRAWGVL